ncbi:MAG: response regulator, partial [Leptospiraceae bacterium]|nr:response regulator [Leptospiraceae bacterium]
CEVVHVSSLAAGFARLSSSAFDVIMLDLGLPDSSGLDTLFRVISSRTRSPIVVTTAESDPAIEARCLTAGAQDVLIKGQFNQSGLFRALRNAISRSTFLTKERERRMSDLNLYREQGGVQQKDHPRILIIEDDEDQINLLADLMIRMKYRVSVAQSARETRAYLQEEKPDLILLDLHLPDEDGIELTASIRAMEGMQNLAILMMSADYSEQAVVGALSSGVNDFISKPIRSGELSLRIASLLELKRKEVELAEISQTLQRERNILGRYFSQDFVDDVLQERISAELGGNIQRATVMFFDLRKSTDLAELISPSQFAGLLSMMMNDLMEMVFATGGSVNKLLGDGMLVTFGLPVAGNQDALNALDTALKFKKYFQTMNELPPFELPFPLDFGVGIVTGDLFAGNIGSFRRMEYTVLGDPVNLAARIEDLTKRAGVNILLDGETRKELEEFRPELKYRAFEAGVRGKQERIRVYHPIQSIESDVHFF